MDSIFEKEKMKTYSELIKFPTFKERFNYLKLSGQVGEQTFGFDRYLNQNFYRLKEWKQVRNHVITRDNQLIAKAYDLVEQRLDDGTATSQETTHFLKLGSAKAKLELEKLRKETDLLVSKKEALDSAKRMEELYSEALNAMKRYGGHYNDE